ncbi:hypothetical protein FSP39_022863 [Pinctada imbricata]|uniref:Uncharacterized protein n=1 Tax=Pinctada imbricata TaxID=66713 RepID=A0AA88YEK7_PINIB|nr:hypothetical protein FSP39_022863 [Pinctada imbricata]
MAEECACALADVNIRSGAGISHSVLSVLLKSHCLKFKGHLSSIGTTHWANVDYNGQNGWISGDYLHFHNCSLGNPHITNPAGPSSPGCPTIISRSEWGARAPSSIIGILPKAPNHVYIHHGATAPCFSKTECMAEVRTYQNYHMDTHGWSDIGYSFIIGEDGNVYEGRGWHGIGAHTYGHNVDGLGFCIIGNFMKVKPNEAALNATKQLISCAVTNGYITEDYILKGHRDVGQTACPGDKLYELIQKWPHYPH